MVSGVYEREFFGDMMIAGIACGVRKVILIFHTNEDISNTGHDPIAVIDPRDYGGFVDTEIPVVVAYNLVHYESLHPVSEDDINETVKLVGSYRAIPSRYEQEYGFIGKDISYLVSQNTSQPLGERMLTQSDGSPNPLENPNQCENPPKLQKKM